MFGRPPYLPLVPRWLLPGMIVFYLGVVAMGVLIRLSPPETRAMYQPALIKGFDAAGNAVSGDPRDLAEPPASPLGAAWDHWGRLLRFTFNVPQVCWADNAINDFQQNQCRGFWNRFELGWLVGLIPALSLLFFLGGAAWSLHRTYAEAGRRLRSGRAESQAIVTTPPEAPLDLFAWFYGLRPIGVQTKGRSPGAAAGTAREAEQRKIYLSMDMPVPEAGQVFAVFAPLSVWGTRRYIGMRYTPHVAVKSG